MNKEMYEVIKNRNGFIAALDQSGGSSSKTLENYGITKDEYQNDEEMFTLIHQMRRRVITSKAFTSEYIIGTILFEKTMNSKIEGKYSADYLWEDKKIVPFLKIDKGLEEEDKGVKLMRQIPDLTKLLRKAKDKNIFGTKMRSVIYEANEEGIKEVIKQQFSLARIIAKAGLVPIIEPEVDINAKDKEKCESIMKSEIIKYLEDWGNEYKIMFKFTLPTIDNFYLDLYNYDCVLKIVALSGGYDLEKAVELLSKNEKVIASFSRVLLAFVSVFQTNYEFDKTLKDVIIKIYNASINKEKNNKKIKFVQYGCGKMSKYTMQFAVDLDMELVGAVDCNPKVIGTTVFNKEVIATKDFEKMLKDTKPDICIVTTMSLMSDLEEVLTICAKNGVNAITTCEEAFYPMVSNPKVTKKLDELAKKNNCTITGTGYQDAFWGNLITTLAGATHKITKIKGSSSYNVEDYGIALATVHGSGMSLEEFDEKVASADKISVAERQILIDSGKYTPSYMWNVVPWLAEKLNLTLTAMRQKCVPLTYTEDIHSDTLNMDIKKGDATGMSAVVTGTTKEGIIIEAECIGKVYAKGEVDTNDWTIFGEPDTRIVITKPDTVKLTCATVVNRIPDVIKAESGFVPTSRMGELKYLK